MQKRVEWVDIAKGIAIICVVAGHVGPTNIINFVYLFHLSAFIFLSGYFYREEFSLHPIKFFSKRVLKLYIMYWIYETVFLLGRPLLFAIGWYQDGALYTGRTITTLSTVGTVKEFIKICIGMGREPLIGAMWFVITLIMIQVGYVILRFVLNKLGLLVYDNLFILAIFLLACAVSNVIYIPRFSPALFGVVFYHLGFVYKKYEKKITVNANVCLLTIALWLLLFYSSLRMQIEYSQRISQYPLYFLATNLIGIICVVLSANIIVAGKGKVLQLIFGVLKAIGQKSFDIMALHFCAFKVVSVIIIMVYGLNYAAIVGFPIIEGYPNWSALYIIVGIALPYAFSCIKKLLINKCKRKEK